MISYDLLITIFSYAVIDVVKNLTDWALLIEQDKSEAFQPINKLRNILIATVFGTFAVVIILVCPIAHFAVKPITRLKRATEKSKNSSIVYVDCPALTNVKST